MNAICQSVHTPLTEYASNRTPVALDFVTFFRTPTQRSEGVTQKVSLESLEGKLVRCLLLGVVEMSHLHIVDDRRVKRIVRESLSSYYWRGQIFEDKRPSTSIMHLDNDSL